MLLLDLGSSARRVSERVSTRLRRVALYVSTGRILCASCVAWTLSGVCCFSVERDNACWSRTLMESRGPWPVCLLFLCVWLISGRLEHLEGTAATACHESVESANISIVLGRAKWSCSWGVVAPMPVMSLHTPYRHGAFVHQCRWFLMASYVAVGCARGAEEGQRVTPGACNGTIGESCTRLARVWCDSLCMWGVHHARPVQSMLAIYM